MPKKRLVKRVTHSFVHTTSHGAERKDRVTGESIRDLPGAIQDLGPEILCENTAKSSRQWARPVVIAKPGGSLDKSRVRQIIQCILDNQDKNQLHICVIGGNQLRNGSVVSCTEYSIIRNGHIRNSAEIRGKFKKRAQSRSNSRNASKKLRNPQCSDFQS